MSRRGDLLHEAKLIIIGIIVGVLICSGIMAWVKYRSSAPSVATTQAPELAKEKTSILKCKDVVVYRDAVAEKLGIEAKKGEHVVASSKLPGDSHPRTVSALYNDETGATRLFERRDPLLWFDFNNHFGIGVSGGMGTEHTSVVGRLDGYWQPLKIKAATLRLTGDITTDGKLSAWGRVGLDW